MFSNQDWNAATSHSTLPMLISLWTIFYILCEWRDKYICVYTRCGDIFIYCIRWCWYEQKKMCTQHHSYRKIIRKERDKTYVPSPIGRECFPSDCFFFLPQKTPMQSDIPIAAAALLDRRPKSQNQLVLFDYSSPVKMAWQRIDN